MSSLLPTGANPFSRDLALGLAGSCISLPLGFGAMKGTLSLMNSWGIPLGEEQTHFHLLEILSKVKQPFLRVALKICAVAYVTLLIPLIEEWVFRGLLYQQQEKVIQGNDLSKRFIRILTNALIFGAFHISLFQGWTNLPLVVVSSVAGLVFASLRELTGSWRASAICHILNNTLVLLVI